MLLQLSLVIREKIHQNWEMEVIKKCQKQEIEVKIFLKNQKVYIETGMPDFSTFYLENKHTWSMVDFKLYNCK